MIFTKDLYNIFLQHPVITTDSRKIPEKSLFFALKGESFNGNDFALEAIQKGAAHSIVDEDKYETSPSCIVVEDVLYTLQELAKYHRQQFDIPVIAITGTNGKTTTKELTREVLATTYRVLATEGNLNNHIGVPLTLLRLKPEIDIAIIEMGANHQGEIEFLSSITQPTHGIITNIGKAHLEGFGGFEGVIKTKTELYNYLRKAGGTAFINSDNALLTKHSKGITTIKYGTDGNIPLQGKYLPENIFVSAEIQFQDTLLIVNSMLFGKYNLENILASASIGQYFQVPPEKIKTAIEAYNPVNNRSQIKKTAKNLLILDAYNANPSSMQLAILHFASTPYHEKSVIIGDMLELGDESDDEHLNLIKLLTTQRFKRIYLVGPILTRLCTETKWLCFQDSDLAAMWFDHHKLEGETILIKGSRGIRLEKLVDML